MRSALYRCHSIDDLRQLAERRLPSPIYQYIAGAADDEQTKARNRDAFAEQQLVPTYLVDVSQIDTRTRILGSPIDWPVIIAPTGMSRLFHHRGEIAVARAAARAGTLYSLSSMASVSIEHVGAASAGEKCFQIYAFKDRGLTREFIERARDAGFTSLCFTVDVPVPGNRERDLHTGMSLPPKLGLMGLLDILMHPGWCWNHLRSPPLRLANVEHRIAEARDDVSTLAAYIANQFDPSVTWNDVAWMIDQWRGPFAIKGILSPEDARHAIDVGASAIWLSNHGGRQLDSALATFDALQIIAEAVDGRAEIILDSGVRRGTDVIKALAGGATACAIGRAYLYGLAAGGEAGVERTLSLLRAEVERGLALLGVNRLSGLSRHHLAPTRHD